MSCFQKGRENSFYRKIILPVKDLSAVICLYEHISEVCAFIDLYNYNQTTKTHLPLAFFLLDIILKAFPNGLCIFHSECFQSKLH